MNLSPDGPQVTIKDIGRDNVEFVLSNVDLAYALMIELMIYI